MYRYWNGHAIDHFYTTNIDEIGTATHGVVGNYNYKSEGTACLIYNTQVTDSVPLYRYFIGGSLLDHFYTTNANEIGTTTNGQTGRYGYVSEGIAGYCFPSLKPGTIPLFRYFRGGTPSDHFYTTNANEIGTITAGTVGNYGYKSEGIVCYVLPYYG